MSSRFYRQLLAKTPVLPHGVLNAAHDFATRHQDVTLLAALASRGDVSVDILRSLETSTHPRVAAALAGRPTRPDQQAAARQTRASVLAAALGPAHSAVDGRVFADAIGQFIAKPTRSLLRALWQRPAIWFTPEQAAALVLALDDADLPYKHEQWVTLRALVARMGPDHASQALRQMKTTRMVLMTLWFDGLDPEAVVAGIGNAVTAAKENFETNPQMPQPLLLAAALRFSRATSDALVSRLVEQYGAPAVTSAKSANARTKAAVAEQWDTRTAAPPTATASFESASQETLVAAAASNDVHVLEQVTTALVARPAPNKGGAFRADRTDLTIVSTLVRNRALPTPLLHRLMGWLRDSDPVMVFELGKVDAIGLHPDDRIVASTWTHLFPEAVLQRHGWASFGGLTPADVVARFCPDGRRPHVALVNAMYSAGISDQELLELPAYALEGLLDQAAEPVLTDRIAALVEGHLGDHGPAWATFEELLETFHGTIGELLSSAALASA